MIDLRSLDETIERKKALDILLLIELRKLNVKLSQGMKEVKETLAELSEVNSEVKEEADAQAN